MSVEAAAAILFGTLQISISLVTLWQQYRVQRDRQRDYSQDIVLVKD
jgi:ABC-type Fe3+ transport system permease subunit